MSIEPGDGVTLEQILAELDRLSARADFPTIAVSPDGRCVRIGDESGVRGYLDGRRNGVVGGLPVEYLAAPEYLDALRALPDGDATGAVSAGFADETLDALLAFEADGREAILDACADAMLYDGQDGQIADAQEHETRTATVAPDGAVRFRGVRFHWRDTHWAWSAVGGSGVVDSEDALRAVTDAARRDGSSFDVP